MNPSDSIKTNMNTQTHLIGRLCRSPILRLAAVLLVALLWSRAGFGGEIHDAASKGDLEKVKALLKDNPKVVFSLATNKDEEGSTPLHFAALKGHLDVVALLLASKADVNAKNNEGSTPLHYAAVHDHKDVAELLLASKADVNAKNKYNDTPLHLAVAYRHEGVSELLRQHGGND